MMATDRRRQAWILGIGFALIWWMTFLPGVATVTWGVLDGSSSPIKIIFAVVFAVAPLVVFSYLKWKAPLLQCWCCDQSILWPWSGLQVVGGGKPAHWRCGWSYWKGHRDGHTLGKNLETSQGGGRRV